MILVLHVSINTELFIVTNLSISDTLHDSEVNSDDSLCFLVELFFVESTISTSHLVGASNLLIPLLVLDDEETDDFDEHDDKKEEN